MEVNTNRGFLSNISCDVVCKYCKMLNEVQVSAIMLYAYNDMQITFFLSLFVMVL